MMPGKRRFDMLFPVDNEARQIKELNGIWKFKRDNYYKQGFEEKWFEKPLEDVIDMPVPSSYNDITTDQELRDHVGWVWYERKFAVPRLWKDQRLVLRFGSVTHHAVIYLNGKEITRHKGGFLPFEADVTEMANEGENRLTVAVGNILEWDCLPVGHIEYVRDEMHPEGQMEQKFDFDFFNYSGIHRPVRLYCTPKEYIEDISVRTTVDDKDGMVHYEIKTNAEEKFIKVYIRDEKNQVVAESNEMKDMVLVKDAQLWQPGSAYLYKLDIYFGQDHYTLPFGIRTIQLTEKQFLINGKPFYFKGFGKHEDSDIRGKGLDEALNVRDCELLKWIGANSFRTSHYPYAEEMMQMADQKGIVVIDEVPAVGMNFFDGENGGIFTEDKVNEKTLAYHKQVLKELYQRDKNHPCVVMWSIANEPDSAAEGAYDYFKPLFDLAKEIDPQKRPCTLVSVQGTTADTDCSSKLSDVICLNRYYGWYFGGPDLEISEKGLRKELSDWGKLGKPVMFTEYGADTVSGLHDTTSVMYTEEYQVEYYEMNNKVFDEFEFVVGEQAWNFADFATSQSLLRVQGNKKGLFTRDRKPKMVAHYFRNRWSNIPEFGYKK